MNRSHLILISLIMIVSCKSDKKREFDVKDDQYQKFEIICDRDTTLWSKSGAEITIQANTFPCLSNNKVAIGFVEILDQADMILNEMYTISSDGQMLESGGMFRFKVYGNESASLLKPIQLKVPTQSVHPHMYIFTPSVDDEIITWDKTNTKVFASNSEEISLGDSLYTSLCTSCHASNLRQNLTGPALGNVHLYRDKDWLNDFTRNSINMIASGDSLALCTYTKYRKVVMTSFPFLTDSDIKAIYAFIENQSALQGIGESEMDSVFDCSTIVPSEGFSSDTSSFQRFIFRDSLIRSYLIDMNSLLWANVDAFMRSPNMTSVAPFEIEASQDYEDFIMVLAFANRKTVIPFQKDSDGTYRLRNSIGKEKIQMPLGEEVVLIAYNQSDNFKFVKKTLKIKQNENSLQLELTGQGKAAFDKMMKDFQASLRR